MQIVPYASMLAVVAAAAVVDLRTGRVYNALTYPAILGGLLFWAVAGQAAGLGWGPLQGSVVATLAGGVPMAVLVVIGGLGGGDMKLLAAVGAISGSWQVVAATALYALVVAAVLAVVVMVRRRIVKRTLGRLLAAAAMFGSRVRPAMPTDSPQVPFAVGIAIGAAVAGAEVFFGLHTPWSAF